MTAVGTIAAALRGLALAGLIITCPGAASGQPVAAPCGTAEGSVYVGFGLPRLAERIKAREPSTILVLGTGSSLDYGASTASSAYPARLLTEVRKFRAVAPITVVNKSVRGESAAALLQRLEQELLAAKPDLVIWQTGSIDAVRQAGADEFGGTLDQGIEMMHRRDIDVMLVTPQYMPKAVSVTNFQPYVGYMQQVAQSRKVLLFDRFEVMRSWADSGSVELDPAGKDAKLKLIDKVHGCVAALIARMIVTATGDKAPEGRERPIASR